MGAQQGMNTRPFCFLPMVSKVMAESAVENYCKVSTAKQRDNTKAQPNKLTTQIGQKGQQLSTKYRGKQDHKPEDSLEANIIFLMFVFSVTTCTLMAQIKNLWKKTQLRKNRLSS